MSKSRLEAFSDGVIAILITILVLNLKMPENAEFSALWDMSHFFLVYAASFAILAVYWVNHHLMFRAVKVVSPAILCLNIVFLFCLSLIPFTTAWVADNMVSLAPQVSYAVVMLAADVVWLLLYRALLKNHDKESQLHRSHSGYMKSYGTIGIIIIGLMTCWLWAPTALIACLLSIIPWIIPSRKNKQRTGNN